MSEFRFSPAADRPGNDSAAMNRPAADDARQRNMTWFLDLIPEIAERAAVYTISTEAMDHELLSLFAQQMQLSIQALHTAVADGDTDGIRRQAHTFSGMGGTAGAPEISVVGDELSASVKRGDLERCGELATRLDCWQAAWRPAAAPDAAAPVIPFASLTGQVLVVDDEAPNRIFLRKLLTAGGATVIEASQGEQALAWARQRQPDLALVDVMMPGMNGYEVCRRLAEDPATARIVVIMVTARSSAEDVEYAFALGAFDYIRKPFHTRELLSRVRNALQLKHQTDSLRCWQARMSHEMDVAGALQRKLLNTAPFFGNHLEVRSVYQSSMSVGGDSFDLFTLPDGRLCVYVADVAGHGVGPAMISTLLKALISEIAREHAAAGPAAICRMIHERFRRYVPHPEIYATLFLALLGDDGGRGYNCGHPMPLLLDAQGAPLPPLPDRGGLPIGIAPRAGHATYAVEEELEISLPPGSALCVFTDGLLESRHADSGTPCGEALLGAVLSETLRNPEMADPARETLRLLADRGYDLSSDDCTLLIIRALDNRLLRMQRAIPPTYAEVASLAAEVEHLLHAEGWTDDAAAATRLLVMEHGANVIDHGQVPPDSLITMQLYLTPHQARIFFRDTGREWDFDDRLDAALQLPDDEPRGRGLKILRALASHLDVTRKNRENISLYVIRRNHWSSEEHLS